MPSAFFRELALDATAAVDEVTAEAWTLLARVAASKDTNRPATIDPSRSGIAFMATYADPEAKPEMPNAYDRHQVRRPGEQSGHPRLIVSPAAIAAAALASGRPFTVVQDDLLVRADDGVTWRVSTAFPMAGGSLKLGINVSG